jgi:putative ABC transport system permease protein
MRRWLEPVMQDLQYAVRSFRRSPGFIVVALLSLMLGIGATSAIFSVIYGVLIAPYPYARPHEIWAPGVRAIDGRGGHAHSLDEFVRMSTMPAFSDVMGTSAEQVLMTGELTPEAFGAILLSGNAFNFLGVPPVAGRTIQPSDIRGDGEAEPVVVLSHRLWLRLFQGDPGAIGRTLRLNNRPYTIIGVMPPRFGWYGNDTVWLPLGTNRKDIRFVNPIVRLAPGVSSRAAEEQLHVFYQGVARENPSGFPAQGFTARLSNYLDVTVASGDMRTTLRLLLGAVGFLLLIACANVANLQLARGTARAREIAVRASIGAGRRRLLRQLLTESVLLSLIGGAAGVLFALGAVNTIVALMPEFYVPNEARVTINTPVLLFAVLVSVLTGIAFGLVPAMQHSKPDLIDALKAGRGAGESTQGSRTRNLLVVVEVALAVVLLVSAGLTLRTFLVLQHTDVGIQAQNVLMVSVPLPAPKYPTLEQRNLFAQQLLERVVRLPGVEAASIGNGGMPFGGAQSSVTIAGQATTEERRVTVNLVGADYLRTFGIALRGGRMFDEREVLRGDRVALINEAAGRLWAAGENPVGARLRLGLLERPPAPALADSTRPADVTIVGIVGNTRNAGFRSDPAPVVLIPYTLLAPLQRMLAVRTAGNPSLLLNPLRAQVREMDSDQPLGRPFTLDEVLVQQVVQPRFTMALFSTFAALGLALAAAGIYSVLSFHVARRTQELGVRMALGAPRHHVLTLMLMMGGRLVAIGLVSGVLVSIAATRLLRSQLFGVTPNDPLAYVAVAVLLTAVALVACYIPARRAAAVDPILALRQE